MTNSKCSESSANAIVLASAAVAFLCVAVLVTACVPGASPQIVDGCQLAAYPGTNAVPKQPDWPTSARGRATLRGAVVDRGSGFALPDALVFLSPIVRDTLGTQVVQYVDTPSGRSNARGGYVVEGIAPGRYEIRAWRASSFAVLDTVELGPDDTLSISFSLQGYSRCR